MRNEYGAELDSNKYAPSILQHPFGDDSCYLCGNGGDLARHEIFHGPSREKSKMYGCWVLLCPRCHERLHTRDPEIDWKLHRIGQVQAMKFYNWNLSEFRERFGKSWI